MNTKTPQEPLRNTIIFVGKTMSDIRYVNAPEGFNPCGLVTVKNVLRPNLKDPKIIQEGLRLVFKHKDIDNCFVNHTVNAVINEKSSLYKTLYNMSGKTITPEISALEAFNLLESMIGHWFSILVEHQKSAQGTIFTRAVANTIYPLPEEHTLGDCRAYFEEKNAAKITPAPITPSPNNNTPKQGKDFSSYPDPKPLKLTHPHHYDISTVPDEKKLKAISILKQNNAVLIPNSDSKYRTQVEIPILAKFKTIPLEDDDLPED